MDGARTEVLAFMRFSRTHWVKRRTTNPLKRRNKELKRRARVVGPRLGEASVIRLIGAVLANTHHD